eukprot:4675375-Amphidinium_carterae.1
MAKPSCQARKRKKRDSTSMPVDVLRESLFHIRSHAQCCTQYELLRLACSQFILLTQTLGLKYLP